LSRIFLSHSSANTGEAVALRDWLIAHGWDDLFLDLDPERGLKAGERWQAALKKAADRCELVIFLVSPEWAVSKWCLAEYLLAKNLNKRIFGVIVRPTPLDDIPVEMTAEWQLVDLTVGKRDYRASIQQPISGETIEISFATAGLERLRIGLMQAGIEARYFAWPPKNDPERAPYRGLQPLEAEDAGIFFGRDGPTVVGLDLLRGLREASVSSNSWRVWCGKVVIFTCGTASQTDSREPTLSSTACDPARARRSHRRVRVHRESGESSEGGQTFAYAR
jgi:TIR domain